MHCMHTGSLKINILNILFLERREGGRVGVTKKSTLYAFDNVDNNYGRPPSTAWMQVDNTQMTGSKHHPVLNHQATSVTPVVPKTLNV